MVGIFFRAADISRANPENATFLYWSDGTAAGTRDLGLHGVMNIHEFNGGAAVFSSENGDEHLTFYSADGTQATALYDDHSGASIRLVNIIDGRLYFEVGNDRTLWSTDGTRAGTSRVNAHLPTVYVGENQVFKADGHLMVVTTGATLDARGNIQYVIYQVDPDGTTTPIVTTSTPYHLPAAALGTGFVYTATTAQLGTELYYSNGQAGDSHLIADIGAYDASGLSGMSDLMSYNGKVLFTANGSRGLTLYVTDGTAAGTQMLLDNKGNLITSPTLDIINSSYELDNEQMLIDGKLLLRGGTGYDYYLTDGTQAGTVKITANFGGQALGCEPIKPTPLTQGWLRRALGCGSVA